jgi:uncharacterized protein (DUF433 family)
VLEQLADSFDTEEFFGVFPDFTPEDVRACLSYARALVAGESIEPPPGPHPRKEAARPTA